MPPPEVVQQTKCTAKLESALMDLDSDGRLQSLLAPAPSRRWVIMLVAAIFAAAVAVLTHWLWGWFG
jgi:hypothetical protein